MPGGEASNESAEMAVVWAKAVMMLRRRRWAVAREKDGGVPRRWWLKREDGRRQRSRMSVAAWRRTSGMERNQARVDS